AGKTPENLALWARVAAPAWFRLRNQAGNRVVASQERSVHSGDRPLLLRERIGGVQDEAASIPEVEFRCGPGWVGLRPPIRSKLLKVVVTDGVRRRFNRLHRVDVEGRIRRRWQRNHSLPEAVKPQEKLNFTPPDHRADDVHRPGATGALVRILAPDAHDEIAPQGTQSAPAPWLRRRQNEERSRWSGRRTLRPFRLRHFRSLSPVP